MVFKTFRNAKTIFLLFKLILFLYSVVEICKNTGRKFLMYTRNFDNLDKMDEFLERHNLPKLKQEEIDNLNSSIYIKHIE